MGTHHGRNAVGAKGVGCLVGIAHGNRCDTALQTEQRERQLTDGLPGLIVEGGHCGQYASRESIFAAKAVEQMPLSRVNAQLLDRGISIESHKFGACISYIND